jgi:hypothetical protein
MSRQYIVKHLSADRVDQAYPLVRSAPGEITLEKWRSYAAIRSAPGGVIPDGGGGVISVESARGYIHGLFDYRIDIDLRCGRTLVCGNIVALDLLNAKSVLAVLFEAMESLAAQRRCQAVHVSVPEGGTVLLSRLEDAGHAVRWVGLCKHLAGDDR